MILVLDSQGLSVMARRRGRLVGLRRSEFWPVLVPSVVLVEALTGDHRRDHGVNRFLKTCQVQPVNEVHAREAARLRTATGRAGTIAATDAVVAAIASTVAEPVVVTSDPDDLSALAAHAARPITVVAV